MIGIRNVRVLDPANGRDERGNLLIAEGKIVSVDANLEETQGVRILEGAGLVAAPGLVDVHVHFRDPGLTYKEDIFTGCAAAARGGVTSMACMANTSPAVDCPEQVKYVLDRAKAANGVGVYPIAALSLGLRGEEPPTPRP